MSILKIGVEDIERLSDIELTKLLKYLLHLEASNSGIQESSISVALNINTGDGGEDGRIKWKDGPKFTSFLPSRFVQFQCKATNMGPASCANEVVGSDGNIKPMVNTALDDGATYVLFANKTFNELQIKKRIRAIREKFNEKNSSYADTVIIEIFDASKISGWVNKYLTAITLVSEFVGRTIISGIMTWEYWGKDNQSSIPFVIDSDREKNIKSIRDTLSNPKHAIRLVGSSGLGKTRLALETFRPQSDKDALYTQVIYCDMANELPGFPAQVVDLVREGIKCILIVDNCSLALHQQLVKNITHPSSLISLLTLDYSETDDTPFIKMKPMESEYIKSMLESVYKDKISDINKIVDFAGGFPQMAVLLANARLNEDPEMGSLTDPVLLEKMLWGNGTPNENAKQIIKGYSLFDVFGFEEDVVEQFDFIAENVVGKSAKECYKHIKAFKKKGIIDQKGRFASVVPKPLAIRLSADFWEELRVPDAVKLIAKDFPGELADALCKNIAKLDFMPKVKVIVSSLCGEQGPFGQAEVILSNLGSRLFRSLVEVNPNATMNALYRVIAPMSKDEILIINGDVRRNIVWSLEKLSFRKSEFQNAARLLLKLSVSENESWSNNATGQFIQLFQTHLSGTEAPPEMRLQILDEAIETRSNSTINIVIKALENAISLGNYIRDGGAENQGSGKPLEDWKPKIWQEVFDYWDGIVERLTAIILSNDELKEVAKSALAQHIRSLVGYGRISSIETALKTIVAKDGKFWPEAIENINNAIKYDYKQLPQEGREKLAEWLELLKPEDIVNRLKLIISVPPYTYEQDENGEYIDQARINAEKLSKEIIKNPKVLMENLPILLTGEQRQARTLGQVFAQNIHNISEYIETGLSLLSSIESPNPELIISMMDVYKEKDYNNWHKIILFLSKDDILVQWFPRFLQSNKPSLEELKLLINQIKKNRLSITELQHFGSGKSLHHLEVSEVQKFVEALLMLEGESAWIALDILSIYTYSSPEKFEQLINTIKNTVLRLEFKTKNNQVMDLYYLEKTIKRIDSSDFDKDFVIEITKNIFTQAFSNNIKARGNIKNIVHYLIKEHGETVWPILFKHIENLTPTQEFRMEQIIGGSNHIDNNFALVDDIADAKIIELCKYSEKAARILSKSIKTVTEIEGNWKFTSIAIKIINEFGDNESILSAISSCLVSFSWTGSPVPYYQRYENAFKDLLTHKNKNVREWAKKELMYLKICIEHEQQRQEEHELGIY